MYVTWLVRTSFPTTSSLLHLGQIDDVRNSCINTYVRMYVSTHMYVHMYVYVCAYVCATYISLCVVHLLCSPLL